MEKQIKYIIFDTVDKTYYNIFREFSKATNGLKLYNSIEDIKNDKLLTLFKNDRFKICKCIINTPKSIDLLERNEKINKILKNNKNDK